MSKSSFLVVAATLAGGVAALGTVVGTAQADVSWQHSGRIAMGTGASSQTLATFDFNNQWSGANHRTFLQYDATAMADNALSMGAPMADDKMSKGELTFIERLDDDRLILAVPAAETYFDEPYSTLKSRLRFNIWEGLDPTLGNTEIPELNNEQRERLGHELRASFSPFTQRLTRVFFRELPNRRTIKGLECKGYRFSYLVNVSGKANNADWARLNAEWWLADTLPGDEEITGFTRRANEIKAEGPLTQSMWANEYFPVLWEVAPPELHRALRTLIGYEGNSDYGFQGTPAQLFVTIQAPKKPSRVNKGNETIRFALELKDRSTSRVAPAKFDAPTGLKKQPIEPALQIMRNFIKQGREGIEKNLDKEFGSKQTKR